MEELYELGISERDMKTMLEMNPNIVDLSSEEIVEKIGILKKIDCTDKEIKNIISSNSIYLDRSNKDVLKLIIYLVKKGFKSLSILIDSNPYILNLDTFEIDKYINNRLKNETLEDIIDDLETNPFLFNEM